MKTVHRVRPGEYLQQIAFRHGVSEDAIWSEPENARLRRLRGGEHGDGHILQAGDVVVIPEPPERESITLAAGEHRELTVRLPKTTVRLTLADAAEPVSDVPYRAEHGRWVHRGRTGPAGQVSFSVSLLVRHVRLVLEAHGGHPERSYLVEVGELDPVDTISGQQQRLQQLGHHRGAITGRLDVETREAIASFRRDHPGELVTALREAYGC